MALLQGSSYVLPIKITEKSGQVVTGDVVVSNSFTIGDITNKNKNSICLLANIIPLKNKAYKKNPPTIIAIIQFIEYL